MQTQQQTHSQTTPQPDCHMHCPTLHSTQLLFSTSTRLYILAATQTALMCSIHQMQCVHAIQQVTDAVGMCTERSIQTVRSSRHTHRFTSHTVLAHKLSKALHSYNLVTYLQRSAAAHHQATCRQCFPPPAVTHLLPSVQH